MCCFSARNTEKKICLLSAINPLLIRNASASAPSEVHSRCSYGWGEPRSDCRRGGVPHGPGVDVAAPVPWPSGEHGRGDAQPSAATRARGRAATCAAEELQRASNGPLSAVCLFVCLFVCLLIVRSTCRAVVSHVACLLWRLIIVCCACGALPL